MQYNGALRTLLRNLGFDCELVYAARVRLSDDPAWRMGHVWVRVHVRGESRELCARTARTDGGAAPVAPLTTVRGFGAGMQALTTAGLAILVGLTLARAAVTRTARPGWLHHPFTLDAGRDR